MHQNDWQYGRLHAQARSFLDGVAVLVREQRRPASEQSRAIVAHEQARAARLAERWAADIADPLMSGALNIAQLTLLSALDRLETDTEMDLPGQYASLDVWCRNMNQRASIVATHPALSGNIN